jgi:GT2 family glycosyltransferase/glycosyltransferase involved in cell wall biosynthesis
MSDPDVPFEVIVVDDAYSEPLDTSSLGVEGVRVICNKENLGFLRSCNQAMTSARGDYLLLLNNDTLVHPGAVEALLNTFEDHETAGAVCAQLRFEDGSLQEAGGIVWRDGSAWNWGRGEDPCDPRFSYPREVDYGSAAALMVERALWERIGGFDESFVPAYYEDTDFCFAVRAAGYRVIYQPQAVVTHLEGVSHGTDTGAGMKSHQVTNQGRFAEKWREVLDSHRANGVDAMLERDRGARARILWVEACMLTPDQDSGSLRTIRLLRILVRMGCKVTYIADNMDGADPYRSQVESEGVEVIHAPFFKSVGDYLKQHGREYDVVTLCRHYIAIQHIQTVREVNPVAQIWFDTIDLHYLRSRRQFELDGKKSTADRAELAYREEMEVIGQSDLTIVVSEVEVEELSKEVPAARVAVVSNIHEISEVKAERQGREGVVFVGGFQHPPNVDAVEFYAEEIWPLFRDQCPGVPTYIIGSRMPDSLRKLGESQGLNMIGFVEDLMPYYMESVLSIAPLRYGAGVKGKVNQALSYGLPVVGTTAALEGMGLEHRRQAMLADSAEAFAAAMAEAYSDQALWSALSDNGQHSLRDRFTPQVAQEALDAALRIGMPGWPGRRRH